MKTKTNSPKTYTSWADVPDHLKTKTGLKNAGLTRRPRQKIKGYKSGRGRKYKLYDVDDAIGVLCTCGDFPATKTGYCHKCQAYFDARAERVERKFKIALRRN